jgi:hypothetical protein
MKLFYKSTFYIATSFFVGVTIAALLQRVNNIFFYNVFYGTLGSMLISLILLLRVNRIFSIDKNQRGFVLIISGLITFSFLSTVPLTIDRSYSVWLLKHASELSANGEPLSTTSLTNDSIEFFGPANGQLDRRINEQLRLGNLLEVEQDKLQISKKGFLIAKINSFIGWVFDLQPQYSKL